MLVADVPDTLMFVVPKTVFVPLEVRLSALLPVIFTSLRVEKIVTSPVFAVISTSNSPVKTTPPVPPPVDKVIPASAKISTVPRTEVIVVFWSLVVVIEPPVDDVTTISLGFDMVIVPAVNG